MLSNSAMSRMYVDVVAAQAFRPGNEAIKAMAGKPGDKAKAIHLLKKIKFNSGFMDGGYIILVEKPDKQGNSHSRAHPHLEKFSTEADICLTVQVQTGVRAIKRFDVSRLRLMIHVL